MTNRTAAARYARALLDVALQEGIDLARVESELAAITDLFATHDTVKKVLLNPAVPAPRKGVAVEQIAVHAAVATVVRKFLVLLAHRDRLVLLPDVLAAYRSRLMDHQKVVRAEVTTAVELAPERAAGIQQRLAEVTGRTVQLTTRVDPAVVGGMVARVGGTVYDGSVTMQLEKMRARLAEGL
jgi:F-type H+-transporting ATPase subunit delta